MSLFVQTDGPIINLANVTWVDVTRAGVDFATVHFVSGEQISLTPEESEQLMHGIALLGQSGRLAAIRP